MKSQNQRILEWLEDRGDDGVCASEMRRVYIGRPGARIHDLRAEGHNIDTVRWCEGHSHHHPPRSHQVRYVLRATVTVFRMIDPL